MGSKDNVCMRRPVIPDFIHLFWKIKKRELIPMLHREFNVIYTDLSQAFNTNLQIKPRFKNLMNKTMNGIFLISV